MSNDQVAADTAALQNYIKQLKGFDESKRASEKQRILNETLKDSSQVARDVAQNTNNLDDVMKVYTASTRTSTSVAKTFGTTKNAPAFKPERKTLFEWQIKSKYLNFFQCPEHNDSPALTIHGVELDSDIKNYKDKADTDKNQGTFIIILFHFSAPFDFSWLPEPERK